MKILENIEPKRVFSFFEDICAIPHGSGNTYAISEYCVEFAKSRGFDYKRDSSNNVIIKKPGSVGYEAHETVILQGHLDMVCEKAADYDFDFTKNGLSLNVDGDLLSADGTTLGADDGIAVAMILAVLDDDLLAHPPIEALFTTDEETGMYGAQAVDVSNLSGKMLINIDSGEEGVLTVGCAGGAKVEIKIPVVCQKNLKPCQHIVVSGLLGGHSGVDINKGRQNADILLGKLLNEMPFPFSIVSMNGGFKDNVIPNSSECVIACEHDIEKYIDMFADSNRSDCDIGMTVSAESVECRGVSFDEQTTKKIVSFINDLPFGVVSMSQNMDNMVQTSLNLGIVSTDDESFTAVVSVRSSVSDEKRELLEKLHYIAKKYDADFSTHGHYPAWEYRKNSHLRDTMVSVYNKFYGKYPVIETIHAGLECGLFNDKISDLDAVSMGPNMWDIHTVNERLSISSTARTYDYICNVLKEL